MLRKHKRFARPRKAFDKRRIEEEAKIVQTFGLKNKKEIWRAEARVTELRRRVKKLISESEEKKNAFFEKLNSVGLNVKKVSDVLALTKEDILNRRLQTIVYKKKLVPTVKTARQMIVHRKITVDGKIINIPSYIVPVHEENLIEIKSAQIKTKKSPEEQIENE